MAKNKGVAIHWFRTDLRLTDNPALHAAVKSDRCIIPVYIFDDVCAGGWKEGAASRWWLHRSLEELDEALQKSGFQPLVLLRGDARRELPALIRKAAAKEVYWNKEYEPWAKERDAAIEKHLRAEGVTIASFSSFLLFEPSEIKNKAGGAYKVFTPFASACREKDIQRVPLPAVCAAGRALSVPVTGLNIQQLNLLPPIQWYKQMEQEWSPGELGAQERLRGFLRQSIIGSYKSARDYPAVEGVSRLSPHLHFGEISPLQIWHSVRTQAGLNGAGFLRQLLWREFSYYLLHHWPSFPEQEWNPKFRNFPWRKDKKLLRAWQQGKTGYPIVDAGMRQLWQTGWMHNRVRMIAGSFLVKDLLLDWRQGQEWFWETLVDADLGNNAAGWQWIAGCGADAAPYFRVFNPVLQSRKFDAEGEYIRKYLPEIAALPVKYIHSPWEAPVGILKDAGIVLGKTYPYPVVDHNLARVRALEAYAQSK